MPKQKILIADDSKAMQLFYAKEISDALYVKQIVADGELALAAYETLKPDIILLDLNMPIVNGYEVLKTIRTKHQDHRTTIIMITSASDKDDVIACAKLGIQGYIIKPFIPAELNQAIIKYHRANLHPKG